MGDDTDLAVCYDRLFGDGSVPESEGQCEPEHGYNHDGCHCGMTNLKRSGHRTLHPVSRKWFVTLGILFLMCASVCVASTDELFAGSNSIITSQSHVQRRSTVQDYLNITICGTTDIRNNLTENNSLSECDIIEGSLSFILIEHLQKNISFPKLKQVTHYVLFYRVKGLQSFADMFPNLAVIRGHELLFDYALIVYENHDLRDLGLIGLRSIMRGTVRIEKNPFLCYLSTVDWLRLTGRKEQVVQDNAELSIELADADPAACPARDCLDSCTNFTRHGLTRAACWNQYHCQLFKPDHCHRFCEGGCTLHNSARHCIACKHVFVDGECMKSCPRDTYLYEGWRCISREKCINMTTSRVNDSSRRYKAFNGSCILECPAGFTSSADTAAATCEPCDGPCPKRCQGRMLDSAARVQLMRGCTVIDGALRIQVSGENIVQELEDNLKDITEITDYLRVSYSEPLVSMDFLRNLRRIRGESLESSYYALYFLHNHNLQSLWPNSTNFTVDKGRAFFHFNHHLCLDKITALVSRLNIPTEDNVDIGQRTNGDKVPCKNNVMEARVIFESSTFVVLEWDNFRENVTDFRSLLGYNIYYREAPDKNISLFSGRDACGGDSWKADDFSVNTPNTGNGTKRNGTDKKVKEMLTGLKPFTQYAFYVETLMADTGVNATMGRSDIKYFTTAPAKPDEPRNLQVDSMTTLSSERRTALHVSWRPPAEPNGIIAEYRVLAKHNPEQGPLDQHFCKSVDEIRPTLVRPTSTTRPPPARNDSSLLPDECCSCSADGAGRRRPSGGRIDKDKHKNQIEFENQLQNEVFKKASTTMKSPAGRRRRRSIDSEAPANNASATAPPSPCRRRMPRGNWCIEYDIVLPANKTDNKAVLTDLRYFAEYTVEVLACHARDGDAQECSRAAIKSRKTNKIVAADALEERPFVSNQTLSGEVTVTWFDPPLPNGGRVLSYVVHNRRMDGQQGELPTKKHLCPLEQCGAPRCRRETRLVLPAGNISVRVQARTQAGLGPISEPVFILVQTSDGLSSTSIVVIVVCVLMFLVVCCIALIFVYKRLAKQTINDMYTSWNPYYGGQICYQPDDWEVDIEKVYFDKVIGKGSFGSVYEGTALLRNSRDDCDDTEQLYRVAIKTLLDDASMYDRQAFLVEASLMKEFNCYHVVRLMGIVSNMSAKSSDNIPRPPFVIMELMTKGDLKTYLRSMRPDDDGVSLPENTPVLPHIYQMAIQIADGMAYLTQMNSVHRDLAARNCMVAEDMTIKIGDFGMTRHLYEKNYYKKGGKGLLPVRWMGPESLRDGRFTSQSDVWSFGVVLWEMVTYAAQPYQGLSNEEVINHVLSRNRMSRPNNCPDRLYETMCRCWEYRPSDRPTFVQLVEELLEYVGSDFSRHSFYHTQRPAMLAAAAADEQEPDVLTPLTSELPAAAPPPAADLRPRIAESEDLSDEEGESDCEMELRALAGRPRRPPPDAEANYAEFEAMKLEGRNGSLCSSADNSKAHSLQFSSSDGSKGSKASNGSARNGYIAGGHLRTAEC